MKIIAVFLFILSISGCATKPVTNEQAKDVPFNQILDKSLLTQSGEAGKVIIKRDSGFMGSACLTRIYLDGKEVADLDTSEKITIYPSLGDHVFSAWPKGMCGGGMSEQSGRVTGEKDLIYRVGYGTNGDFGIYPTAF